MKEIPVTVHALSETTPVEEFLSPNSLDSYIQATRRIHQVEKELHAKQEEAEKILDAAKDEKLKILMQAQETGKKEVEKIQDEFKKSVIKDTMHWLIKEENIEKKVIESLEEKIRTEMAQAFRTLVADLDQNQLLMGRIQEELNKLKEEDTYLLRVPLARFDQTQADLEKYQLTQRLQLITDDKLKNEEVILETPFFLLKIDIARHLETIAHYLKTHQNPSAL